MKKFDITVAVCPHSGSVVAGPTMASANAAIRAARKAGFSVEKIISMDSPTAACRAFFYDDVFDDWKKLRFKVGDLGLARNALVKKARGKWIALLDEDDLFSENWLVEGAKSLAQAEKGGEQAIVHPELNWQFDSGSTVFTKPEQDDPIFTPYYFSVANYYDSLCMAPRKAFLQVPYLAHDKKHCLGYEDWSWNLQTMAANWKHIVARDTIIFKRRRDTSLVVELGQSKTLLHNIDLLAIDNLHDFNCRISK